MLADSMIGLIRTFVPVLVGSLTALLVKAGITLDVQTTTALTAVLVALFTSGYYALVTLLERKVNPAFGWLLGVPKAPSYASTASSETSVVTDADPEPAADVASEGDDGGTEGSSDVSVNE